MSIEGLVSKAGVALGLQLVVAEVHDHGEGVEQPAADHAQLVVVQPQLLQPRDPAEGSATMRLPETFGRF